MFRTWLLNYSDVCTSKRVDEDVSGGKPSAGKGVGIVCQADVDRTLEFVLHIDGCNMVTLSPNQIIIIMCSLKNFVTYEKNSYQLIEAYGDPKYH